MAHMTSGLPAYSDEQPQPYAEALNELTYAGALNERYASCRHGMECKAQQRQETQDRMPWQRFKRWFSEKMIQADIKRRARQAGTTASTDKPRTERSRTPAPQAPRTARISQSPRIPRLPPMPPIPPMPQLPQMPTVTPAQGLRRICNEDTPSPSRPTREQANRTANQSRGATADKPTLRKRRTEICYGRDERGRVVWRRASIWEEYWPSVHE